MGFGGDKSGATVNDRTTIRPVDPNLTWKDIPGNRLMPYKQLGGGREVALLPGTRAKNAPDKAGPDSQRESATANAAANAAVNDNYVGSAPTPTAYVGPQGGGYSDVEIRSLVGVIEDESNIKRTTGI